MNTTALKTQLNKEAEAQKEAQKQLKAFEFGQETFLAQHGLDKAEFAKLAGVEDPSQLGEATAKWANEQISKNNQPAPK